jgi:hypothetical protein
MLYNKERDITPEPTPSPTIKDDAPTVIVKK